MVDDFYVGDNIEVVTQGSSSCPPPGTVGTISSLYEAFGGPAAKVDWTDKLPAGVKWGNRILLSNIKLVDNHEIDESDEDFDILFRGTTA